MGGGVVGCATAYELARAGCEVTLIERDAIAAHASGRSAGNLNPLHGTPAHLIPFALEAFRIHAEIRTELMRLGCASCAASPAPRIHVAYDEAEREPLEMTAGLFKMTGGFSSVWLERNELRRIEVRLAHDIRFAVLTEGNLSIDGYSFTRALAEGAVNLGASILHDTACGVAASGARVTGVRTKERTIVCDDIVLATGAWVASIESWLGINLSVEPVKGELLLMRLPGQPPRYDFTWGLTSLYRRRASEVWVGVTMDHCGFDSTPTSEAKTLLLDRAARIMPCIQDATLLHHIAGLRPMPVSNAPLAGRARGWENVYIANGGGAKGILLSVAIARRIRDLLLDGRSYLPGQDLVNGS